MEGKTFISLVLSGLCFLPACFPRLYILVEEAKTWAEAQSYCRENYTDLASAENQEESEKLEAAAHKHYYGNLWIGLYDDIYSWRWSLEKEGYYGEGEAEFRNWDHDYFNNKGGHETCARMSPQSSWRDLECSFGQPSVCYDETSSSFILVEEKKTWKEAQSYCRGRYTDLASVRNQTENDQIKNMVRNKDTWIGLYRDSWKWSNGSPYLFTNWHSDRPLGGFETPCVALRQGRWEDLRCDTKKYFLCYADAVKQQVFRLKVTKKDSSVNLEDAADAILQQLGQRLQDLGLSEDMKLTWRKQPDAKIFTLEDKEEEKEEKEEKEEITCT